MAEEEHASELPSLPLIKSASEVIEPLIHAFGFEIERHMGGNLLSIKGHIIPPLDEWVRDALEAIESRQAKLIVVLETEGGFTETVSRIVDTMRHHYPHDVEFVVPNYAYSAGTVLALSGNELHMDYFSVLGPTDPQDQASDGRMIPALGYVQRYQRLIDESQTRELTMAELTVLVQSFDQGKLEMFSHAREQAAAMLTKWLPKYKFRDWTETESSRTPVTEAMRQTRAQEIAQKLADTDKWHSHGIGISRLVLEQEVGLKTKDFGADSKLKTAIGNYTRLIRDYMHKMGFQGFVHTPPNLRWF